MITLTYGLKRPETNDKGPVVFPALEGNIDQLDGHDHDGSNSAKIPTSSLTTVTQTLLSGNWVSLGGGNYHQQVNMNPGFDYDLTSLSFRNAAGDYVYPSVIKISSTIFDVTTNDASSNMIVIYGV